MKIVFSYFGSGLHMAINPAQRELLSKEFILATTLFVSLFFFQLNIFFLHVLSFMYQE